LELETAQIIPDDRTDHGEARFRAHGWLGGRLQMAFTMRDVTLRAISSRRADAEKVRRHGQATGTDVIDDDNPEWTESDFARAKPFKEVFPEQYRSLKNRGGRPEVNMAFRSAAELVEGIRVRQRLQRPCREGAAGRARAGTVTWEGSRIMNHLATVREYLAVRFDDHTFCGQVTDFLDCKNDFGST
jgi:hypothetical protein